MHSHSLNRTALAATLHCLTGCAIGEVLGDPERAAAFGVAGATLGRSYRWSTTAQALLAALERAVVEHGERR